MKVICEYYEKCIRKYGSAQDVLVTGCEHIVPHDPFPDFDPDFICTKPTHCAETDEPVRCLEIQLKERKDD